MPWAIAIFIIAIDIVTKNLVTQKIISVDAVPNYGLAFSLPTSETATLIITAGLMAVIIFYFVKNHKSLKPPQQVGFALIAGGGFSNFLERLYRGAVTDFINIANTWLNFADLSILLGILILLVSVLLWRRVSHNIQS